MANHPLEPEWGSREHATATTLRTYRHDLDKITDKAAHADTINAMVKRIEDYHKQHDAIQAELGPRIRELEAKHDRLPKESPQRAPLEKQLAAIDRTWDRRLAPFSKALHKDLDAIVAKAVAPYHERERAVAKKGNDAAKTLRSRELADAFRARQHQQQTGKDHDRER